MKPIFALIGALLIAGKIAGAHPGDAFSLAFPPQIAEDDAARAGNGKPQNKVSITIKDGVRTITSNGIPDHPPGQFPNRNNPGTISEQNYVFTMPAEPKIADQITPLHHGLFGVALNGVPFDPGTAEFWNRDPRADWNYEALTGKLNLGTDASNAHVQPGGVYHYHGLPTALIANLQRKKKMTQVGWAADGFPIYANYGYAKAGSGKGGLQKMRSSYRLKQGTRPGGNEGPGGAYDGTFTRDYEYVAGSGDLDECNGRFGVTPEFPKGVYHYFITEDFPFIPRNFRGTPDVSFQHKGPGGGRPNGGPGGGFGPPRGGGFGPPGGGFGPPGGGFGPPDGGFGPPPPFPPPPRR